jgi:patched 1
VYVACALVQFEDVIRSQSGVGLGGVILVGLTVSAGLGLCAVLGLPFNASTIQIVPFLALGLGMSDLFLLLQAYAEQSPNHGKPEVNHIFLHNNIFLS